MTNSFINLEDLDQPSVKGANISSLAALENKFLAASSQRILEKTDSWYELNDQTIDDVVTTNTKKDIQVALFNLSMIVNAEDNNRILNTHEKYTIDIFGNTPYLIKLPIKHTNPPLKLTIEYLTKPDLHIYASKVVPMPTVTSAEQSWQNSPTLIKMTYDTSTNPEFMYMSLNSIYGT